MTVIRKCHFEGTDGVQIENDLKVAIRPYFGTQPIPNDLQDKYRFDESAGTWSRVGSPCADDGFLVQTDFSTRLMDRAEGIQIANALSLPPSSTKCARVAEIESAKEKLKGRK